MKPVFILGSASPRRLDLLRQINLNPDQVLSADIDETPLKREKPSDYVSRIAREKAEAILKNISSQNYVLLCADTTVSVGARILGKPETPEEAERFLNLLSGRRHRVMTAIYIATPTKFWTRLVKTRVLMKRLSKEETQMYLASNEWQGKAGGYAIQGLAEAFIPWINGSYSNVVGLPLTETRNILCSAGVQGLVD
jgi:septum formation protein